MKQTKGRINLGRKKLDVRRSPLGSWGAWNRSQWIYRIWGGAWLLKLLEGVYSFLVPCRRLRRLVKVNPLLIFHPVWHDLSRERKIGSAHTYGRVFPLRGWADLYVALFLTHRYVWYKNMKCEKRAGARKRKIPRTPSPSPPPANKMKVSLWIPLRRGNLGANLASKFPSGQQDLVSARSLVSKQRVLDLKTDQILADSFLVKVQSSGVKMA